MPTVAAPMFAMSCVSSASSGLLPCKITGVTPIMPEYKNQLAITSAFVGTPLQKLRGKIIMVLWNCMLAMVDNCTCLVK